MTFDVEEDNAPDPTDISVLGVSWITYHLYAVPDSINQAALPVPFHNTSLIFSQLIDYIVWFILSNFS